MGLIAMSARYVQRIEVLPNVADGRMTLVTAAHVLALSDRQVRRLVESMRANDVASIRHEEIGRPSDKRVSYDVRDYVPLVRARYADFGSSRQVCRRPR